MDVKTLIEQAAKKYGTRAELARAMKKSPSRVSEWASGVQKPDAHEIAFMAECAGLPVLQTVAEIEAQLDERYASIWREALGKLTAAGVTAALLIAPALLPKDANATTSVGMSSVYYVYRQAHVAARFARSVSRQHLPPRNGCSATTKPYQLLPSS